MQPASVRHYVFGLSKEHFLIVSGFLCYRGIGDEVSLHTGLQLDVSSGSTLVPPWTFLRHLQKPHFRGGCSDGEYSFHSVGIMENSVA